MNIRERRILALLGGLFVATGFVALIAEQAFEKLLGLLLGTSTPAGAVVLAVYFAGLTLGAAGYARVLRPRVVNPLAAYALLEGCVALWVVGLALTFDRLVPGFAAVLRLGAGRLWFLQVLRSVAACLWILPPTVCMGATFPAVADALEVLTASGGRRTLTRFYGLNLLGGLLAVLLGPYLLLPMLGLDGTLVLAFALDAVVALCALAASAATRGSAPGPGGPRIAFTRVPPRARVLLAISALSGFLFFALEVLWTHLIGAVLGNSVYAFASMLGVVLAGLALGGLLMSVVFSRREVPPSAPPAFFLAGATVLGLTHGLWPRVPHSLATLGGHLTSFGAGEALRLGHAAALLLVPATVLGMAYPSLFRLAIFPEKDWSAVVGRMGAWNALGCIAGALFAGFVLLPGLGSEASLLLIMALDALAGITLAGLLLGRRERLAWGGAGLAVLAVCGTRGPWNQLALTSGEHVYFQQGFVTPESRLVSFHEDAAGGVTTVIETPGRGRPVRTLLTNGKFQGNDGGEVAAQTGCALAPILSVAHPNRALVIGLGTGNTARAVAALGFARRDVVEIAPGIVDAARHEFGSINGGIIDSPGTRVSIEDGRNFLLLHRGRYDLITMEISSVWFAGSTNLYSREFYALARANLAPGGVLQQWIQLHHLGTRELASVIATARAVFPVVSVWVIGGQGIIVASDVPQVIQATPLLRLERDCVALGWRPEELAGRYVGLLAGRILAPGDTDRLVAALAPPVNTDRNRFLEYATPRYNLSRVDWGRVNGTVLAAFAGSPVLPAAPGLAGPLAGLEKRVDRALQLRLLSIDEGMVMQIRNRLAGRITAAPRH